MNLCVLCLVRFGDIFPTFIVDFLTWFIAGDTINSLCVSFSCLDILLNEHKQITDPLNFPDWTTGQKLTFKIASTWGKRTNASYLNWTTSDLEVFEIFHSLFSVYRH